MNNKMPECFGTQNKTACQKDCKFKQSCLVCSNDDAPNDWHNTVSYEKASFSSELAAHDDSCYFDDNNDAPKKYTDEDLLKLMNFILRIDDYSLGIITQLLSKPILTASDLAKLYNVSRQAMHRKIVDAIRNNPELATLFKINLYRCKIIQSEHLNHGKEKLLNDNQQDLF